MSIIGITGTRRGLTPQQKPILASYVRHPSVEAVHHGDCVGVDAEAHTFACESLRHIVIHPPIDYSHRALCGYDLRSLTKKDEDHVTILEPRDYLARNRDIVDACTVLIACPYGPEQKRGSGTWAAIRYARQVGRELIIIWPNGTIVREHAHDSATR